MDYYGDLRPLDGSISGTLSNPESLNGSLSNPESLTGSLSLGLTGPIDYETKVINKPSINTETVEGHKLGEDYNLQDKMNALTVQEVQSILYNDPGRR